MTPGPLEETGKTAVAIVESLKQSPAVLALIVLNVIFIAFVYFGASETRASFDKALSTLIAQQAKISEMLYNCTPVQNK